VKWQYWVKLGTEVNYGGPLYFSQLICSQPFLSLCAFYTNFDTGHACKFWWDSFVSAQLCGEERFPIIELVHEASTLFSLFVELKHSIKRVSVWTTQLLGLLVRGALTLKTITENRGHEPCSIFNIFSSSVFIFHLCTNIWKYRICACISRT
jgi:hypothetical protein